jgi:DNA-binding MarR family transcriptional regulator
MSATQNIIHIIEQYAEFEKAHPRGDLHAFYDWAVQQQQPHTKMATVVQMGSNDAYANAGVDAPETAIGILLSMLNKYARNYSKIAMSDLPINSPEEFGYLAKLSTHAHMAKTELATSGMDGKTTGMEIINRLMLNKLISEKENPEDKRSKLLALTPLGRKVLAQCYMRMGKVAHFVVGNLTTTEKQTLKKILLKLEAYHKKNESSINQSLSE